MKRSKTEERKNGLKFLQVFNKLLDKSRNMLRKFVNREEEKKTHTKRKFKEEMNISECERMYMYIFIVVVVVALFL